MLLPKRVRHRMKKQLSEKEIDDNQRNRILLKTLVGSISVLDRWFLDDENAIVLVNNSNEKSKNKYIMIHYRLVEGKLVEINRWYQRSYFLGSHEDDVIEEFNLFMVPVGYGIGADVIYNYKLDKFIVPKGQFDCIGMTNWATGMSYGGDGPNYLKEYGCFLAYFSLSSTYEELDIIAYQNLVTREQMTYDFNCHEVYFALLDPDGTIRDNKLFKGDNFSRIVAHVELDDYSSLDEFKKERIAILNQEKQKRKKQYLEKLARSGSESVSPYLDEEVLSVLKRVRKKDEKPNQSSK